MGCGYDYICRTCKKSYYVGYGSYGTWWTVKTLQEWEDLARQNPDSASLHKNQCVKQVLTEHNGHDLYPANWDYHDHHHGALTGQFGTMGADVVIIPDYAEYEHVNLYGD